LKLSDKTANLSKSPDYFSNQHSSTPAQTIATADKVQPNQWLLSISHTVVHIFIL